MRHSTEHLLTVIMAFLIGALAATAAFLSYGYRLR